MAPAPCARAAPGQTRRPPRPGCLGRLPLTPMWPTTPCRGLPPDLFHRCASWLCRVAGPGGAVCAMGGDNRRAGHLMVIRSGRPSSTQCPGIPRASPRGVRDSHRRAGAGPWRASAPFRTSWRRSDRSSRLQHGPRHRRSWPCRDRSCRHHGHPAR
jgi:hypothetical protein